MNFVGSVAAHRRQCFQAQQSADGTVGKKKSPSGSMGAEGSRLVRIIPRGGPSRTGLQNARNRLCVIHFNGIPKKTNFVFFLSAEPEPVRRMPSSHLDFWSLTRLIRSGPVRSGPSSSIHFGAFARAAAVTKRSARGIDSSDKNIPTQGDETNACSVEPRKRRHGVRRGIKMRLATRFKKGRHFAPSL